MMKLAIKNPSKWGTKLLEMARTSTSQQLTEAVEAETQYNVYQMSIEVLLQQLPLGKVMMAHTTNDPLIPYRQDHDPLFTRVARITLPSGSHLFFSEQEARELLTTWLVGYSIPL